MKTFIATNILIDVEPAAVMYLGLNYHMGWMEPLSFVCLAVTLGYAVPWLLTCIRKMRRRRLG